MNSLNLQGISWNFFARDRCVSVSITQSRLIARGHHQRRLILFRVGSIPPKNYLFFFFSFFFFPLRGTRERHPIARRYSFSLSSAGSIRTQASSSSKIGVPLSILKVNEINHPARRYIYIYIHTYRFCCSPPPPSSPLPHIFTVISGESDGGYRPTRYVYT